MLETPPGSFQTYPILRLDEFRTVLIGPTKDVFQTGENSTQGKQYYFTYAPSRISRAYQVEGALWNLWMAFLWSANVHIEKWSKSVVFKTILKSAILAYGEAESCCGKTKRPGRPPTFHVEKRFWISFQWSVKNAQQSVHWEKMPVYFFRPVYLLSTPCLLECKTSIGPNETIEKDSTFNL